MTLPVSILIPCHNAAVHLEQCLQSALAQDAAEIILLDDASTDTSRAIALQYQDRLQVHHSDTQQGAQATRNQLFTLSSQAWVQYLDADDYLLPRKIGIQLDQSSDADILYCDFTIERWEGTSSRAETWLMDSDFIQALLLYENPGQTNCFLYRRETLAKATWNETATYQAGLHGQKLNLDLLKAGARFKRIPQVGFVHRRGWSGGQITDQTNARVRMLARLAWRDELQTWVKAEHPNQYEATMTLEGKRLHHELSVLGMGQ